MGDQPCRRWSYCYTLDTLEVMLMRRTIRVLLITLFIGSMNVTHADQPRDKTSKPAYPKLESYPIVVKPDPQHDQNTDICAGPDCKTSYKMPPEQLQRMRELDGIVPGGIIQLRQSPIQTQPSRRDRSASPNRPTLVH